MVEFSLPDWQVSNIGYAWNPGSPALLQTLSKAERFNHRGNWNEKSMSL